MWLAAACKVLAEAFEVVFEVAASSAARSPRPLGVRSEFRIDGDFRGRLAFGIPAASREFTTLLLRGKAGGNEEETWALLSQKIADLWLEMLRAEAGLACTIGRISPAAEQSVREGDGAQARKPKRRGGRQQTAQGGEEAALFSTLKSSQIALPVYLILEGEGVSAQAKETQPEEPRSVADSGLSPSPHDPQAANLNLLLDIEVQASLRFGGREMLLGEILDLGPGDVVSLDRPVHAPVDLVVGDRIVARGEVVLVDGNYGLRILEVAEPQKRLETVRCLF